MKTTSTFLILAVALALFSLGCHKDDSDTSAGGGVQPSPQVPLNLDGVWMGKTSMNQDATVTIKDNYLIAFGFGFIACGETSGFGAAGYGTALPVTNNTVSVSGDSGGAYTVTINFTASNAANGTVTKVKPPCTETVTQTFTLSK